MRIKNIHVTNFRLLRDVEIHFDEMTTVIVGRNNSGKTSLTELFRRLHEPPKFSIEDFSLGAHEHFWNAWTLFTQAAQEDAIRKELPTIEVRLTIAYEGDTEFGSLSEFIIDLDATCTSAIAVIRYELADGRISDFFSELDLGDSGDPGKQKTEFFKSLRERIHRHYKASLFAEDPADQTNVKALEWRMLSAVMRADFINAQRGLDDSTSKEHDVLGKVLEALFTTANSGSATSTDQTIADEVKDALRDIQENLGTQFNKQLDALLPAFALFGYPSLPDPDLRTETSFDVDALLKNHTRLLYPGANGVHLPETYNGLGTRNLIFILLKLHAFFKSYKASQPTPSIHVVFIEEPEAHLHPQMQEVFIEQLAVMANEFVKRCGDGQTWPIQFVVTTHSSHIANRAPFKAIRYFLTKATGTPSATFRSTAVKDLSQGFEGDLKADEDFLHKYMTLTRCDLLFADKAILIEGTSERLLLPKMIKKCDATAAKKLSTQYVSVVEVGGAHAHLFFGLLAFLEMRTLLVTDLDSVDSAGEKCMVSTGVGTSNGCIQQWYQESPNISVNALLAKTEPDKVKGMLRIAFQVPESPSAPCGRSFEQAFILANLGQFALVTSATLEGDSWLLAKKQNRKKADFALERALDDSGWLVPLYIAEGLRWLTEDTAPVPLARQSKGRAAKVSTTSANV